MHPCTPTASARGGSVAAKAKSIEERAKDAKANGKRLSAAKQSLRDTLIVQRRAQQWTLEAIAAEAGVTTRTMSCVLAEREAIGEALLDRDWARRHQSRPVEGAQ